MISYVFFIFEDKCKQLYLYYQFNNLYDFIMNAINQIREITFMRRETLTSSKENCKENFTFTEWAICQFKIIFSKRYSTYLVCQTKISKEIFYELKP